MSYYFLVFDRNLPQYDVAAHPVAKKVFHLMHTEQTNLAISIF